MAMNAYTHVAITIERFGRWTVCHDSIRIALFLYITYDMGRRWKDQTKCRGGGKVRLLKWNYILSCAYVNFYWIRYASIYDYRFSLNIFRGTVQNIDADNIATLRPIHAYFFLICYIWFPHQYHNWSISGINRKNKAEKVNNRRKTQWKGERTWHNSNDFSSNNSLMSICCCCRE